MSQDDTMMQNHLAIIISNLDIRFLRREFICKSDVSQEQVNLHKFTLVYCFGEAFNSVIVRMRVVNDLVSLRWLERNK